MRQSAQSREARTVRNPEVQNHDGDNVIAKTPSLESFPGGSLSPFQPHRGKSNPRWSGYLAWRELTKTSNSGRPRKFRESNDLLEKMASMRIRC